MAYLMLYLMRKYGFIGLVVRFMIGFIGLFMLAAILTPIILWAGGS